MYFKQFYLACLAHASYLIGSDGEAAVVDPQRDVEQYLSEAAARNLRIKYVVETHLHADFVSGHRELAARAGAEIVFGRRAGAAVPHLAVSDGDVLEVGRVRLRVLETPGHTPESISLLVTDTQTPAAPPKVLTGDTLFIGDVGRPDLAGSRGYTPEQMAGMLYDSLHGKLLRLADETEVYPAHGAGSMCGRNISKETSSTIGEQRRTNYALREMSREEFVRLMTIDLPEAPAYFPKDAEINRAGAAPLGELPRPQALAPREVKAFAEAGAGVVLDLRAAEEFGAGHVPGAVNVGLAGQFASWAGALLPLGTPLVLVAEDEAQIDEAIVRLARVGHEEVRGYLAGGMRAWREAGYETDGVTQISVDELRRMLSEEEGLQVLDVRRPGEYEAGHAPRALNVPLSPQLAERAALEPARAVAVICAGGYRSSAATSLLRRAGFRHLLNVRGGTSAWVAAGYEVERPAPTLA
jgi:glyoxylase-like metal-dependent hydrolase (beta-lactamase superfamily II)/rhodanese-related sulfurtransferase